MNEMLESGRKSLAAQPFSVLLGANLVAFEPGRAEIHLPIVEKLKQHHGFVHGGVVSYAADNTLTFAGGSVLGGGVVTSEYKINYVRPATGDLLIARAAVVYGGKSQAVVRCDVFTVVNGTERLCATAQGTIVRMSRATGAEAGAT
jgi:uncharacterized protein (TIGR00369 family)